MNPDDSADDGPDPDAEATGPDAEATGSGEKTPDSADPATRPAERRRVLAVASVSLLLSVLVWFNYSAVLPLVAEEWGLSGVRAGVVFAAFQAGYLVSILPAGALVDARSPRRVIAAGATGTGMASLGFALLAEGFLVGTLLRFAAGLCMAGVYVPGMRLVSDWFPEAVRGRAMGLYVGTFSLGSGLSFLVSSSVAAAVDWRLAVAVTSVGALAVGPLVLGLTRDAPGVDRNDGLSLDLGVVRNRSYRAAVGVYAWHNWELFGARNWLLAYLVAAPALGGSEAVAGLLTGVAIAAGGIGNALGGWLSDRVGRLRIVGGALGASGLLSATLGVLGGLPAWFLGAVVVGYGVVLTADSAPTSTAVTELVADERVGSALALQSLAGFATTVVSPVVFGAVLDGWGFGLAFPTLAVGAGLALASVGVLARRQRPPDG